MVDVSNLMRVSELESAYDEVSTSYDSIYMKPKDIKQDKMVMKDIIASYTYKELWQNMLQSMSWQSFESGAMLNPFGKILDAGCGTGLLLERLPVISPLQYRGVDLSGGMLRQAREKFPEYTFIHQDIREYYRTVDEARHMDPLGFHLYDSFISIFASMSFIPLEDCAEIVGGLVQTDGFVYIMFFGPKVTPRDLVYESADVPFCTADEVQRKFIEPLQEIRHYEGDGPIGRLYGLKGLEWCKPDEGDYIVFKSRMRDCKDVSE